MAEEKTFKAGTPITTATVGLEAIPEEFQERTKSIIERVETNLVGKVESNMQKALVHIDKNRGGPRTRAGEWIDPFIGYEVWDIAVSSPVPIPLGAGPPAYYWPNKIVRAGEPILFLAALFINPLPYYASPPGITHLAGENCTVRFEQVNLTNVVNGPESPPISWKLGTPASVLTWILWLHTPSNPGPAPLLMELNVTADITEPATPYAAFATQWVDLESDPGWPLGFFPPIPGGLKQQTPLRYLVYS